VGSRIRLQKETGQSRKYTPGIFDWFEELIELSKWSKGRRRGIGCKKKIILRETNRHPDYFSFFLLKEKKNS